MASVQRDYESIAKDAAEKCRGKSRDERMHIVVDCLWSYLHPTGVSWVGFYLEQPDQPENTRLVLGPCRDKPACSPIGLHGVCGQALTSRSTHVISDVLRVQSGYIACDPRDRSEIVVPVIDKEGRCWGVLDLDSHEADAFNESDSVGLHIVLVLAGLIEWNVDVKNTP